jgi:DNA polymerase-3 subunit epsilon
MEPADATTDVAATEIATPGPRSGADDDAGRRLPRFSVVDIETSGLSTRRHRILQIAVVTVDDGVVVDEWSSLIKLRWPFQRVGPRRVHGIDRRMLRDAPSQREVLAALAAKLDGAVFTAHNVRFDWPFITKAAQHAKIELAEPARLCTLRLSRQLDPDRQLSHRLGDVCTRYGITNERPHDALYDARATALVLPHLLEAHGVRASDDLLPLYERR